MPPNANYTLHYDGTVTVSLNYIMHERPKENPEGLINQLMSILLERWGDHKLAMIKSFKLEKR